MDKFFEKLNGREIFHYSGAPCFIEEYLPNGKVKIYTEQGKTLEVNENELDSPSPEEMEDYV